MADDDKKKGKAKKKSDPIASRVKLILFIAIIMAVVFLPTTVLLLLGMMPTLAAAIIDKTKNKYLMVNVGLLNFAGCYPFILELWQHTTNTVDDALSLVTMPRTIMIIYVIAALGYIVDYAVSGIVTNVSLQQAKARVKQIEKRKKELIARWGVKVNGTIPLNDKGQPV